jgi:hypothetical protein
VAKVSLYIAAISVGAASISQVRGLNFVVGVIELSGNSNASKCHTSTV